MDENQVQNEELVVDSNDDNLFADYESEEKPAEEEKSEETVEEETPTAYLKVKYNGEDKDLTEDEARTYAQKGMNYDRFYSPLEKLAKMNGMSVDGYLNQLNETQFNYEVAKEVDNLREDPKYADLSDEILEEIASSRVSDNMNLRERDYEEQAQRDADAQTERAQRDLEKFFNEYPEFRDKGPNSLDPQVFELCKQGYTLLEAYNKWSRESTEAKISKQNEENKKRSLGNTSNAGSNDSDDFLRGFLEG